MSDNSIPFPSSYQSQKSFLILFEQPIAAISLQLSQCTVNPIQDVPSHSILQFCKLPQIIVVFNPEYPP